MKDFEIFCACFPMLSLSVEDFLELSDYEHCCRFTEDGGFALTYREKIILICVSPALRGQGIGKRLLHLCEENISLKGYPKAEVGGFLCGAPEQSAAFFQKYGYSLGGKFYELRMNLNPLPDYSKIIKRMPRGIEFDFYHGDFAALKAAVLSVDEEWVQYFDGGNIFCAKRGDEILSFCIVSTDECCLLSDGASKIGSIGCVGTVPSERGQGIALCMTALAVQYLQKRECDKCFIHYTHIPHWYERLGFRTFYSFCTAEKVLEKSPNQ